MSTVLARLGCGSITGDLYLFYHLMRVLGAADNFQWRNPSLVGSAKVTEATANTGDSNFILS